MANENERQQKLVELVELRRQVAELERDLGIEPPADQTSTNNPLGESAGTGRASEEASLEAQIAAERISSMANLARGIAHEINNPLATCLGYLQRAAEQAEDLDDGSSLQDTLQRLKRGVARIHGIVNELQMLAEEMIGEHEKLDLSSVVDRVCGLVPPDLRAPLDLELDSVCVWVDRPRLYQIAYNMIMPHLLVARKESNDTVHVRCRPDDDRALLEVTAGVVPSPGTRTDLLSALRGEYTPTTLPLRLARRLAIEAGARWHEGACEDGSYRTAVLFDAV